MPAQSAEIPRRQDGGVVVSLGWMRLTRAEGRGDSTKCRDPS